MPEKMETLKATPTIPVYAKLLLAALVTYTVLGVVLMAGAYLRYREESLCAAKRSAIIAQIEQFHEQHGRYPTDAEAKNLVSEDAPFRVSHYEITKAGFQIELSRAILPPGDRIWTYDSETKSWNYDSVSW